MTEYGRLLGCAVKRARTDLKLTQEQTAERSGVDIRTIINIEKFRGNPKLENLYPLVNALYIDAREIFDDAEGSISPEVRYLHSLVNECSQEEATMLIPIFESILATVRAKVYSEIK